MIFFIYILVCLEDPPHPIGNSTFDWDNSTRITNSTVSATYQKMAHIFVLTVSFVEFSLGLA